MDGRRTGLLSRGTRLDLSLRPQSFGASSHYTTPVSLPSLGGP